MCLLLTVGCRTTPTEGNASKPGKTKEKPVVTPDRSLRGRVAMVNPNTGSVVLSFPIGWLPVPGRTLNVYRDGLKVGEVKITGPQMDTNIAGDLVAGEAREGDEAREE